MDRREFISVSGATLLSTALWPGRILGQESRRAAGPEISWHWHEDSNLFDRVAVDGRPLMNPEEGVGLLDGFCRLIEDGQLGPEVLLGCDKPKGQSGPAQFSLAHQLLRSTGGAEVDVVEATLTLKAGSAFRRSSRHPSSTRRAKWCRSSSHVARSPLAYGLRSRPDNGRRS